MKLMSRHFKQSTWNFSRILRKLSKPVILLNSKLPTAPEQVRPREGWGAPEARVQGSSSLLQTGHSPQQDPWF